MGIEKPVKNMYKGQDKTTGVYKIAAKIIKKVKSGSSYKTQLYQAQYPVRIHQLYNQFRKEILYYICIRCPVLMPFCPQKYTLRK